jgi:hypothetical protein
LAPKITSTGYEMCRNSVMSRLDLIHDVPRLVASLEAIKLNSGYGEDAPLVKPEIQIDPMN